MTRNKGVVLAFLALGEAGKPALLPQGGKLLPPAGQQLVRIALMPDVPHDLVVRAVKNTVQSNRQLHRPQVGCQMSPCFGGGLDQPLPDLCTQHIQLLCCR